MNQVYVAKNKTVLIRTSFALFQFVLFNTDPTSLYIICPNELVHSSDERVDKVFSVTGVTTFGKVD